MSSSSSSSGGGLLSAIVSGSGGGGTTNFKVDVRDYLGLENTKFKNKMMQIALTNPSEFYKFRDNVLENVVITAIGNFYDVLFGVMTEGKLSPSAPPGSAAQHPDGGDLTPTNWSYFRPKIPQQKVSEFALKCTKTMEDMVQEAVDLMLPEDYLDIARARLARKSDARGIDI